MANNKVKAQPFDCMQYFYTAAQEPLIRCFVQFNGHLNENALIRAVDLSIGAIPLIACCFDEKSHCWRKHGFTADSIVHLIEARSDDGAAAKKTLLSSIDRKCGPQLKIFIVRGEKSDALCIIINHMVSDGGGFKEYLYLLAGLYSKCEKDERYHIKPEPFGKRNLNQLLRNLTFMQKLGILFSKAQFHKPDPAMILPIKGDPSSPTLVIRRIEKEPFARIRSFAKSSRASINDMLLAAYIRVLHKVTGCINITVPCPVDLRKYKTAGQTCGICNLTSNYFCHVDMTFDEPFGDTLKKVSTQMRAQKESDACLKGPMLYHMMFHLLPFGMVRKLFYKISPVPVTSYTNLGIIDDEKFCFGNLAVEDVFISTAVKKAPYFQLSVSTYRGRCTLTSSFYGTKEDQNTVEKFLSQVENEMNSLFI